MKLRCHNGLLLLMLALYRTFFSTALRRFLEWFEVVLIFRRDRYPTGFQIWYSSVETFFANKVPNDENNMVRLSEDRAQVHGVTRRFLGHTTEIVAFLMFLNFTGFGAGGGAGDFFSRLLCRLLPPWWAFVVVFICHSGRSFSSKLDNSIGNGHRFTTPTCFCDPWNRIVAARTLPSLLRF